MDEPAQSLIGKVSPDMNFGSCRFKSVIACEQHKKLLYSLLEKRRYIISHQELPEYNEHCDFVENHSYRFWYLVCSGDQLKGSLYVKDDNSIGLNLLDQREEIVRTCLDFTKAHIIPRQRVPSVVNPNFHVNVSHENRELKTTLRSLGMLPIQETFYFKEN
jgi:hypothetical protein